MEANNNEDPFKVRLKFSTMDYVKMVVLGVTLLPLRLTGENISYNPTPGHGLSFSQSE